MHEYVFPFEGFYRGAFFLLFAYVLFTLEKKRSWRYVPERKARWVKHLGFVWVSTILIRLIFPLVLVDLALEVRETHRWSLLMLPETQIFPQWSHYILAFIGMDFIMYWQHRILHKVGPFWRLHLMHHTDRTLDASTGLRFHPFEYLFSMGFKMLGIILIGPPAIVVLIFEIVLNAASMFTHANIQMSPKLEQRLRKVIVTPSMHRVHHSDIPHERNSNFGFFLSIWDKLLGTYRPYSMMSERKIVLGEEKFMDKKHQTVMGMLLQPFFSSKKRRRKKKAPSSVTPPDYQAS